MSMGYGYAAQVVGGVLEAAAAGMDQNKMAGKLRDWARQEQEYQREGMATAESGIGLWSPQNTQAALAQGRQQRQSLYNQFGATPMAYGRDLAGSNVSRAQDQASIAQQAQAQAALGSYGDFLVKQTIGNMATQRNLNQLSSAASGNAQLLPLQLYQAQHSYDWLAQIGALIGSLGTSTQPTTQTTPAPSMNNPQATPNQYSPGSMGPYTTDYPAMQGVNQYAPGSMGPFPSQQFAFE